MAITASVPMKRALGMVRCGSMTSASQVGQDIPPVIGPQGRDHGNAEGAREMPGFRHSPQGQKMRNTPLPKLNAAMTSAPMAAILAAVKKVSTGAAEPDADHIDRGHGDDGGDGDAGDSENPEKGGRCRSAEVSTLQPRRQVPGRRMKYPVYFANATAMAAMVPRHGKRERTRCITSSMLMPESAACWHSGGAMQQN